MDIKNIYSKILQPEPNKIMDQLQWQQNLLMVKQNILQ